MNHPARRFAPKTVRQDWNAVRQELEQVSDRIGIRSKAAKRFARKFKRTIHLVDSTTIPLIAACMDWAKHRRRKAAAKCHLRLDLQSFLPRFAIVDTARHNDAACRPVINGKIPGVCGGKIEIRQSAATIRCDRRERSQEKGYPN